MPNTPESGNDVASSAAFIGRRVKMKRISLDLTVGEAARRAGLTPAQFSNLEHGRGNPTATTMDRALAAVDMTPQDLAGGGGAGGWGRPRPPHAVDYGPLLADMADTPPRDTPGDGSTGLMLIDWKRLDE